MQVPVQLVPEISSIGASQVIGFLGVPDEMSIFSFKYLRRPGSSKKHVKQCVGFAGSAKSNEHD